MAKHKLIYTLFAIGLALSTSLHAQEINSPRMLSFEQGAEMSVLKGAYGTKLSRSNTHVKHGDYSLCWTFGCRSIMSIHRDIQFEPVDPSGVDTYLSAFIVWIYNEKELNDKVTFQFLKAGKYCCSFDFNVNYHGWRAAWVCFERDMQGVPEVGMDEIRVIAPNHKGRLWIDHMITAVKVDARQQTADRQVPFVNSRSDNHWLQVYRNSLLQADITPIPMTDALKNDIQTIEKRFREVVFHPVKVTPATIDKLRSQYQHYAIKRDDKRQIISGMPIFFVRAAEAYERILPNWDKDMFVKMGNEMGPYFQLMQQMAVSYCSTENPTYRQELENMFLMMYDHITDQGVVDGSCWGNVHHYGYSLRWMYAAYYLMKDVLLRSGRLEEATRTLLWYAQTNELYRKPTRNGIDMDTFNTAALGCMASILIAEDGPEKIQRLLSMQRWLDWGCRPADGLSDAFKSDGSAYHHCNNYPAYAVGGLSGATQMIYLFSGTRFAVGDEAYQTVKHVLLNMRFYCNDSYFPLAMSGRHLNGKGQLIPIHYAYMAMAGRDGIDKELAQAFLRLTTSKTPFERKTIQYLKELHVEAEETPMGNLSMPYACSSIHRRDNWSAVVRGHSRYLWAAEHYTGANRYGRYMAHGSMQIGYTGAAAWQQEGFDWNRIPGTTAIHLPLEKLEADIKNVDTFSGIEEMLYSDEAFAGGLSQGGMNGCFGMKLHEHDKYNGSLRARKSYHFLNDFIVCIGTDIENTVNSYQTETTLFQEKVLGNGAVADEVRAMRGQSWMMDPAGTGYYLPASIRERCMLFTGRQKSRYQDSGKENEGNWMSLVVNHGNAPHDENYEYAVVPATTEEQMKVFAASPRYQVLQKNRYAHIIETTDHQITSYVLFEKPVERLPEGIIELADTCCLMMVKKQSDDCLLTVAQPDLALYRGQSDDIYDEQGKRVERSIYSRPWIGNASQEIPVTITLRGSWTLSNPVAQVHRREVVGEQTLITVSCREGRSIDLLLKKI